MLNGAGLNSSSLNGGASAGIVLATAAFVAGSTFTAVPTNTQAANANITVSTQALFNATGLLNARISLAPETSFNAIPRVTHAGTANWEGGLSIGFYSKNAIPMTLNWEVTSVFTGSPNAQLGNGTWSAGASSVLTPVKTQALAGGWSTTSTWDMAESLVSRGASADWVGTTALWAEPTITRDGVPYHDGYWFGTATAALEIPNNLTTTLTYGNELIATADWLAPAIMTHAIKGDWVSTSELTIEVIKVVPGNLNLSATASFDVQPRKTVFGDVTGVSTVTTFTGKGLLVVQAQIAWELETTFIADNRLQNALIGDWSFTTDLTGIATRHKNATVDWASTNSVAMGANVKILATANWAAAGNSSMTGLPVLHLVPAPTHRQFVVTGSSRTFTIPTRDQAFKVAV